MNPKTLTSDKATRENAIPFVANSYGLNIGLPEQEDSIIITDMYGVTSATNALRVIRLCRPERGNLIQAYLNLFMNVGSALTAKVSIGRFASDGINVATPSQVDIDAGHLRLAGTTSAFASSGSTLVIDGLNILSLIPKKGETGYNADGFVLIVQFSRNLTSSDSVRRFEVSCSMQMGLL